MWQDSGCEEAVWGSEEVCNCKRNKIRWHSLLRLQGKLEMFEAIFKRPLKVLLGLAGIFLIISSVMQLLENDKYCLKTLAYSSWNIPVLSLGVILLAISVIWHIASDVSMPLIWTVFTKVKKIDGGLSVNIDNATINVKFGKMEEQLINKQTTLVALPANEFFDDECIKDNRSSLGAFVMHNFSNRVHEIQVLAHNELATRSHQLVNLSDGSVKKSYDIGSSVYLDSPLNTAFKIAFVSVTTVREDEGIKSKAVYVLRAVETIHTLMNNHRINNIVVPILGSGHGGLTPEVSLISMLIGFAEAIRKPSGHHIKNVDIIVFKKDKSTKPIVSVWRVKRLLAFIKEYC